MYCPWGGCYILMGQSCGENPGKTMTFINTKDDFNQGSIPFHFFPKTTVIHAFSEK